MSEDDFARLCLAEDRTLAAIKVWEENIEKSLGHVQSSIEGMGRAIETLKVIRGYMAQGDQ